MASRINELETFVETRPDIEEGYNKDEDVVIRLVSNKKSDKVYRVSGIEDVASKNNWKAWIYLFPVIILLTVFLLYPLINTIFMAFTKNYKYASGTFEGMTFENFGVILGFIETATGGIEKDFTSYAIPNTLFITFITVPVSIALALIISVLLNSIKWFQKILQTVFFLPYVTNAIAVGMVFSVIFDQSGVVNNIIFALGGYKDSILADGTVDTRMWTPWIYGAEQWKAMIPLCIYIVWSSIPFKILVLLSGLQGIDKQYYQAAQIDSCPKWKVLLKITVPLLSPQILYLMITSFIGAFKEYTSVVGLFGGPGTKGVNSTTKNMLTIVFYVYDNLATQTSRAAAAAVFLFVIILIFTAVQFQVSKRRVHY